MTRYLLMVAALALTGSAAHAQQQTRTYCAAKGLNWQSAAGGGKCTTPVAAAVKPVAPTTPQPALVFGLSQTKAATSLIKSAATIKRGPAVLTGGTIYSLRAKVTAVDVHDLKLSGIASLIDTPTAAGSVSNGTFARIEADGIGSRGFIKLRGPSSNLLFEDISLRGFAVNTSPGDVPCGICFAGKAATDNGANIVFRRVSVDGVTSKHGGYLNGDGIATEARYSRFRFENIRLTNNIDSGLDNKASGTVIAGAYLEGNGKNAKLWYGIEATGVVSVNPRSQHLQLFGKADGSSVFTFTDLTFRSAGKHPLFVNGTPKNKMTVRCTNVPVKDVPAGTPLKLDPYGRMTVVGC